MDMLIGVHRLYHIATLSLLSLHHKKKAAFLLSLLDRELCVLRYRYAILWCSSRLVVMKKMEVWI